MKCHVYSKSFKLLFSLENKCNNGFGYKVFVQTHTHTHFYINVMLCIALAFPFCFESVRTEWTILFYTKSLFKLQNVLTERLRGILSKSRWCIVKVCYFLSANSVKTSIFAEGWRGWLKNFICAGRLCTWFNNSTKERKKHSHYNPLELLNLPFQMVLLFVILINYSHVSHNLWKLITQSWSNSEKEDTRFWKAIFVRESFPTN
jgi:hypothetical protein